MNLKIIVAFMLFVCPLSSCQAKSIEKIDRELRELDDAAIATAIAVAGLDTTQLNPTEKLLLRQLVAGKYIQDDGEFLLPAFEPTKQDYLLTENYISVLLRDQGYVAPTPELFRKQVQRYFGFEPGEQHQHMTFEGGDEGWVKTEDPFCFNYYTEEVPFAFHLNPDKRQISLLLDLPTLMDYRARFPQLAAVEKYVNREKRLSLLLDKFMPDLSKQERAGYSLILYSDFGPEEWLSSTSQRYASQLVSYNKFLFNNDPASFGLMLIRRDPLIDYISYMGGLRPPKIEVGQPISSLVEFHGEDSLSLRNSSWSVLNATEGDLNGDAEQDLALVIGLAPEMLAFDYNNPDSVSRNDFIEDDEPCEQLRNRILIIAMREKGELRIHTIQPDLIPQFPNWNSNADDPFEFLEIKNGNLVLTERSWMSMGSWWMSVSTFNFEYDPTSNRLLFNKYWDMTSHRATGETTDCTIDLKRGMSTRISTEEVENQASPDGMSTIEKTVKQSFTPIPLLSIDTLKRGVEYRVSKETDEEGQITIYTL